MSVKVNIAASLADKTASTGGVEIRLAGKAFKPFQLLSWKHEGSMTMFGDNHSTLLEKLRFGERTSDRSQALKDLIVLEQEGGVEKARLVALLSDKDFVFQSYAISAVGRLKVVEAIPKLKKLFSASTDPIILTILLETFVNLESNQFVDVVLKRLQRLNVKGEKENNGDTDNLFLLEQIILPSLKYFQIVEGKGIEASIRCFLSDSNPTVRWHTLVTFDKLGMEISDEELTAMKKQDSYALVREQAAIMLEKKNVK